VLGPLARAQGNSARAWSIVRTVFPGGPETEPGELSFLDALPVIRLAAALATDADDLPSAHAWLAMHDRWLGWSGALLGKAEGAIGWSAYHAAAGDLAQAHDAATHALERASEPRQPLALLAVHRCLGELDTDAGRYAEAAAHLETALALAEACNTVYERALTLLSLAALKQATDDGTAMTALLDEARPLCASLGATPLLARADALAVQRPVAVAAVAYPDGLTEREVDVLREIAAGRSNKEIADILSISGRTVDRHIANLYTKIGAHNKADAASYAFRHRLAR
jgi:DNA-binding CsgD family transcriptional regulator